jgi:aspartate/tyrosine/aromatic aminotransferase
MVGSWMNAGSLADSQTHWKRQLFCVQNMGLYGQRIGTFSLTTADPAEAKLVESQMKVSVWQGTLANVETARAAFWRHVQELI